MSALPQSDLLVPESVLWRCRDGPLAAALASGAHTTGTDQANDEQQRPPSQAKSLDDDGPPLASSSTLAAFASTSRDARVVLASSITALRPSVLLPEAIARR
jgi:hypothetical protein